jgi:hypothetical protein
VILQGRRVDRRRIAVVEGHGLRHGFGHARAFRRVVDRLAD